MNKRELNKQDDTLKEILSGTKIKAGENLKFRIMQQIETEKALSGKKASSTQPSIGGMITIFGVMYAMIAIIAVILYSSMGESALKSITFFIPVILIASVCAIFWMISVYDDSRRSRHKSK